MVAEGEDVGEVVCGAFCAVEVWVGAEDGGAAGEDDAACVEADGDEGEEEAEVEGDAVGDVASVEGGDDGVDKGAVCYDEGAGECGLYPVCVCEKN